jgi:hypothetical protein
MNITESIHIQTLLGWLLDPHTPHELEAVARNAAVYLAARAAVTLGAGPGGPAAAAGWSSMLTSCAGCSRCPRPDPDPVKRVDRTQVTSVLLARQIPLAVLRERLAPVRTDPGGAGVGDKRPVAACHRAAPEHTFSWWQSTSAAELRPTQTGLEHGQESVDVQH